MKTQNQKGITLIALIITIIVMMILVAVSVNIALGNGLFKAAQDATKGTKEKLENENTLANGGVTVGDQEYETLEGYVQSLKGEGGSTGVALPENLKVGDIIEYVPSSQYTSTNKYSVPSRYTGCTGEFYTDMSSNVEWKVLEISGNTIKIIPKAVSSDELTISGANGWNNSISAIKDVCEKIYGNTTSEKYTGEATSLTVEDINGIAGYTPPTAGDSYNASNYGIANNKFPTAYLADKGVKDITEVTEGCGYATNSSITVEKTSYVYKAETQTNFNQKFAEWIGIGECYWLASRCVNPNSSAAPFGLFLIGPSSHVQFERIFISSGYVLSPSYAARPVVTLTSKVQPVFEKTVGEGDAAINYWKFE